MFLLENAITGGRKYWTWILSLFVVASLGLWTYCRQLNHGLGVTGLSRDIPWGLYIAQFTLLVGIAASAAITVLPYYARRDNSFRKIALLSQALAVAAVVTGMLFVFADMGRPARVLNVLFYPAVESMMFWDLVSLIGYLVINVAVMAGVLRAKIRGADIPSWVRALALLSIPWAIAMRTSSALLYSGLAGRSFWLSAATVPRALASACAAGAALLILVCLVLAKLDRFEAGREPLDKLALVAGVAMVSNLFLVLMEFFTAFYSGVPEPIEHFAYILGRSGAGTSVAIWMWLSMALAVTSAILLLTRRWRSNRGLLASGCAMACVALWIEKSISLAGGFVPSPSGALAAYVPTLSELSITVGIWAAGLLLTTVFYKIMRD